MGRPTQKAALVEAARMLGMTFYSMHQFARSLRPEERILATLPLGKRHRAQLRTICVISQVRR